MAARFLEQGSRLVCLVTMAARYLPRDTLRGLARQYEGYGFYRAATARRHPPTLRRSALLMPLLVCCWIAALLAPRTLRRVARMGVSVYLATLAGSAAIAARKDRAAVAISVPLVLATMHLSAGVGFLRGMRRFGIPWQALARTTGIGGLTRLAPAAPAEPVHAPSLDAP